MVRSDTGKTALVVEGGGMRSIFAAGVLHAFGNAGFDPFNLYIGTSGGACCLASHLAGQNDRNLAVFARYSTAPEFFSLIKFLRGGHYMDLDWLWQKTIAEYRLDLDTLFSRRDKTFLVVVTSVGTGQPVYLTSTRETLEENLKASSALPLLYRRFLTANGTRVTDGGLSDSIPVFEAVQRGADKIMVIRSRPETYVKKITPVTRLTSLLFLKHTALRQAFLRRPDIYMKAVAFMNEPPDGVKVLQITPPAAFRTRRTTRNKSILTADYELGVKAGIAAIKKWGALFPVPCSLLPEGVP